MSHTKKFHGLAHHNIFFDTKIIDSVYDALRCLLKKLKLRKKDVCLIGTGISGSLCVPLLAHKAKMNYCLARQPGTKTVCGGGDYAKVIGYTKPKAIFIDDLIESGTTVKRVHRLLKKRNIELVGMVVTLNYYCYNTFYVERNKPIPIFNSTRKGKLITNNFINL